MKFVTLGSFIIQHEAPDRDHADDNADGLVRRMEDAISDRVLVSDYLLQHQVRPAEREPLEGQLGLFEGGD